MFITTTSVLTQTMGARGVEPSWRQKAESERAVPREEVCRVGKVALHRAQGRWLGSGKDHVSGWVEDEKYDDDQLEDEGLAEHVSQWSPASRFHQYERNAEESASSVAPKNSPKGS